MIFLIAFGAFFATLFGGIFALKFKDRLHVILGFSAGAVIGVAFFDLIPEAINLVQGSSTNAVTYVALGFAIYLIIDRFLVLHTHHGEHHHESTKRGILGAGSLSIHSFLDGVAIGLAFHISASIGAVVAIAVLAHDFSDGINTVNMILKNHGNRSRAFQLLLIDALAPVFGVIATNFFSLSHNTLGIVLAIFAGFFLYIGASDLLPESHHNHPTMWTTFFTLLGMAVLFIVVKIAG